MSIFSLFALLVACLGLFGLASYMAEQRTKEIGIRKVLGASVRSIVFLLSQAFFKLIVLAFVVAVPIAYCHESLAARLCLSHRNILADISNGGPGGPWYRVVDGELSIDPGGACRPGADVAV